MGDQLYKDLSDHFQQYMNQMLAGRSTLYAIGVGEWACVFRSDYGSDYIHQQFSAFVEQLEKTSTLNPMVCLEVDGYGLTLCGFVSRRDFPMQVKMTYCCDLLKRAALHKIRTRHFYCMPVIYLPGAGKAEQLSGSCVSRAVLGNNVRGFAQPIVKANTHELSSYECLVRIVKMMVKSFCQALFYLLSKGHIYTRA